MSSHSFGWVRVAISLKQNESKFRKQNGRQHFLYSTVIPVFQGQWCGYKPILFLRKDKIENFSAKGMRTPFQLLRSDAGMHGGCCAQIQALCIPFTIYLRAESTLVSKFCMAISGVVLGK